MCDDNGDDDGDEKPGDQACSGSEDSPAYSC